MELVYDKALDFIECSNNWKLRNPGDTKFGYALDKVGKQLKKAFDKENNLLQDKMIKVSIEHCSVDKDKNILKDIHKEFVFTQEALIKRNDKQRIVADAHNEELDKKVFEVIPHIMEIQIPEDLTFYEKDSFAGLVIPVAVANE